MHGGLWRRQELGWQQKTTTWLNSVNFRNIRDYCQTRDWTSRRKTRLCSADEKTFAVWSLGEGKITRVPRVVNTNPVRQVALEKPMLGNQTSSLERRKGFCNR